jgi:hypothetical protein
MTSRAKRIAALEAVLFRPVEVAFVDPFPLAMRLWEDLQAVCAGRAEWIPVYGPHKWSEAAQDAFDRAVAMTDAMAKRLAEGPKPG